MRSCIDDSEHSYENSNDGGRPTKGCAPFTLDHAGRVGADRNDASRGGGGVVAETNKSVTAGVAAY